MKKTVIALTMLVLGPFLVVLGSVLWLLAVGRWSVTVPDIHFYWVIGLGSLLIGVNAAVGLWLFVKGYKERQCGSDAILKDRQSQFANHWENLHNQMAYGNKGHSPNDCRDTD